MGAPCDPHDVVGVVRAADVRPEDQVGGRRVVVGTVEEKALDALDVGFDGALHTHHPLLKARDDLHRRFSAEPHKAKAIPCWP